MAQYSARMTKQVANANARKRIAEIDEKIAAEQSKQRNAAGGYHSAKWWGFQASIIDLKAERASLNPRKRRRKS